MNLRAVTSEEQSVSLRRKINENSNIIDQKFNEVEGRVNILLHAIDDISKQLVAIKGEMEDINKKTTNDVDKAINIKYARLGEASSTTMKTQGLFVDKSDKILKFKDKNGTIHDLT